MMSLQLKSMLVVAMGWLSGTQAFALDKVDGAYQIANADQLVEFATIVNNGENDANGVLTADIDMTGVAWTPIGNDASHFKGVFDGQYHTIDHLKYESAEERIGIFGVVDGGCVIKNFIAGPDNEIRGVHKVGGIVGCSDGSGWVTLENVGHEGYVFGTGNNVCAIIGVVMNGGPATRITNCYNTGNVCGGGESAIIAGWFGGHGSVEVRGFWNTGVMESGQDGGNSLWRNNSGITAERIFHLQGDQGATVIEDGDLTSGKLAFELNDNQDAGFWRQNLSEPKDLHPVFLPDHLLVYANGELSCDGSAKEGSAVTYSNTEGSVRDDHHFTAGFCTVCGLMQEDFCEMEGEHYLIDDGDKLNWFAYMVNNVNGAANGKLTADIDMTGKDFTPIGQDAHDFKGHFDGMGHRILNLVTNADRNNQALFGQAVGGAVIENIIIDASCQIQGTAFTMEMMESGELAYLLNGKQSDDVNWYQLIGTNKHPLPLFIDGGVVYANGSLDCAGNPKAGAEVTYSNTDGATRDDHQYENGTCVVCGTPDVEYTPTTSTSKAWHSMVSPPPPLPTQALSTVRSTLSAT